MKDNHRRPLSKDKYIAAAVITLCIFLLGLFLGFVIEEKRVNYIQEQGKEQKLTFESLQLQYMFVDQLSQENNCEAISKTFDISVKDLEGARIRLEKFDENAKISKDEFDMLKKDYTIAQLRYWLLAKKAKALCNLDLTTIIYFYSTDKVCPDCEDQAFILTYLKQLFGQKLLIFSLDANFEKESMIDLLKSTYSINKYPSLVFDEKKFEGLTSKEKLIEEICKHITDGECKTFINQTANSTKN